ncbi:MAG TPA: hypothetical protein VFS90_13865 [Pyrinomonadaceae bacterium]|nr:hypothetical protein [Pyrinomonadaceae bacterium]
MTKTASEKEIKDRLIKDANDPNAWGKPIKVSASRASRPEWYGRAGHLQLAAKFYVLSVLHFLGADANLTSPQSDNVDITVVKQPGEAFTIQVKTLMGTSQWPVEKFSARKHHFVAFICYERESHDPQVAPDVYIWASERLKAFIARDKTKTVSLDDVASKLDPKSAWKQFVGRPAA